MDDMPKIGCVQHDCKVCKTAQRTAARKEREALQFLSFVYGVMRWLDIEFANAPRTPQTKRVADNTTRIENAADLFAISTLGLSFRKLDKLKKPKAKD